MLKTSETTTFLLPYRPHGVDREKTTFSLLSGSINKYEIYKEIVAGNTIHDHIVLNWL
jgi:hypothetical protein